MPRVLTKLFSVASTLRTPTSVICCACRAAAAPASSHSQPADAVQEDESFYLLTYDDHTFKIRKALVREVEEIKVNSESELPQQNPAAVKTTR